VVENGSFSKNLPSIANHSPLKSMLSFYGAARDFIIKMESLNL
jgi:hypothetical protein